MRTRRQQSGGQNGIAGRDFSATIGYYTVPLNANKIMVPSLPVMCGKIGTTEATTPHESDGYKGFSLPFQNCHGFELIVQWSRNDGRDQYHHHPGPPAERSTITMTFIYLAWPPNGVGKMCMR